MKPFAIQIEACLLGLLAFGGTATGASIPSGGYTNNFPTQPGAGDWSTLSIAGGANGVNDSISSTQVGTNIAVLTAGAITNQLAAATNPPAAVASAVWCTNGFVQTRPTGNRITVLMASFSNGTGSNVGVLNISYDLTLVAGMAEEVLGHRAYYSLSGATNSWVAVNALSGANTNLAVNSMSASLPLGVWATNASLYLLWADDNGSSAPDTALQIDNVVVTPAAVVPVAFTTQPQSTVVAERSPATFSFTASGTLPSIQWYKDNVAIPGANATNYTLASALVPDSGSQFYAIISNALNSATSSVATLTVLADTNAPIALAATYDEGSSNVVVRFSEALKSNSLFAVNFYVFESLSLNLGPAVINATVLDATNVLVSLAGILSTGVSYSISAAGVEDTALSPNTMSPNPTVLVIRPSIRLINFTDVWKYDINNGDRSETGWQNVGFDDSAWPSGAAGLGRDNSINGVPINTIIPYMSNGVPCYFRKHFHLPSTVNTVTLTLRDVVEDGAVFYLNGREVLRRYMPAGPVVFTTFSAGGPIEPAPVEGPFNLPANYLVAGDNVLAVEVHQLSATSTDVEMAAELTANIPSPYAVPVYINEFMAANTSSLPDPADGLFEDWFELYNAGDSTVDLGGFHLTDILSNTNKFTIPAGVTIPPHGYLLFWADNSPGQGSNHVNFAFSNGGEAIGLYAPDFSLVDAITFGPQQANISQGRAPDGSANIVSFATPTPQALNPGPPVITIQPQSLAVGEHANVSFSVGITSSVPVTYQWHVNCRNIHNATNATLSITDVGLEDIGTYSVTVLNLYGQTTSWDASLRVTDIVGGIASDLFAKLVGTNLSLTWPASAGNLQLQEALNLDGVPPAWSDSSASVSLVGADYFAIVPINAAKKFYRLVGNSSSVIEIHPLGRSANLGETVTLTVVSTGAPPILYQWRFNGFNLDGATNAALTQLLTNKSQFGAYQAEVYPTNDTAVSRPAVLRPAGTQSVLSDSFAGRPLFTDQSNSIHGVTFGASSQPGETNFAGFAVGKSVWLRWRAPGHGFVKFDTIGSAFDTILLASTGSNIAGLTPVAADDDAASNLWSAISFNVISNVEYNVSVSGLEGAEGFFVLNWALTMLPSSQSIPIITGQPQDQVVPSNTVAMFTVAAQGLAPLTNLTYQWYYNGTPIPGNQTGTNATLVVGGSNAAPSLLGPYFVDVKNGNPALTVRSLNASLQFASHPILHFVTKPSGDPICSSFFLDATNCCGGNLAASGHKPASGLPPVISYASGTLVDGTKITGASSSIVTWAYVPGVTWDLTNVEVTLTATVTSGKVQLELTTPGATVTSSSYKFSSTPLSTTATLKFTPVTGKSYTIGIGREKRDATFTLKASQ